MRQYSVTIGFLTLGSNLLKSEAVELAKQQNGGLVSIKYNSEVVYQAYHHHQGKLYDNGVMNPLNLYPYVQV